MAELGEKRKLLPQHAQVVRLGTLVPARQAKRKKTAGGDIAAHAVHVEHLLGTGLAGIRRCVCTLRICCRGSHSLLLGYQRSIESKNCIQKSKTQIVVIEGN